MMAGCGTLRYAPMPEATYLTRAGLQKLQQELEELQRQKRRLSGEVGRAAALGDLRENAEYHAAKEQQGFVEGRIADFESRLSSAQVIDPLTVNANGRVVFGATLDLLDEHGGQEVTYQIVGDYEADLAHGRISISSPIARALIGKEEGDVVEVQVPGGLRTYEILDIRYI